MSSANHERDSDYVPDDNSEDLNSDEETGPFTTLILSPPTIFKLPTSNFPVFPPVHTFVKNLLPVDTDPSIHLVEFAVRNDSKRPQYKTW